MRFFDEDGKPVMIEVNAKVVWFALALLLAMAVTACTTYLGADRQVVDKGVGISLTFPVGEGSPVDNYVVSTDSILSVYDGDTFFIRLPECADTLPFLCARIGVRITAIDTPEIRGECEQEKALALGARALLQGLLESGEPVTLVAVRREKYGRLLASVRVGVEDVASRLVAEGLARPYDGGARQGWCPAALEV